MDASAAPPPRGDFVAWNGGCAFIGQGHGAVAPHAHYAIQVVVGMPGGLRVQLGRRGEWQPCAAALVPSLAVHSIDVTDCGWSTVIFVEPETVEGRALSARLAGRPEVLAAAAVAADGERLGHAWQVAQDAGLVRDACVHLVHALAGTTARTPSDARVLAAIAFIGQSADRALSLDEVAAVAHLSPSRFRHLFVEQTGMPLRSYLLWRRLLRVWTLLTQGESLSGAAHGAGFADSAHLSRTARSMFGVTPSTLRLNGPLSRRAQRMPAQSG